MTDRWGRILWSSAQGRVGRIGIGLIATPLLAPEIGVHAARGVLIPLAPALLVSAPNLRCNVCPLGTTSLLPRTGTSLGRKLSEAAQRRRSLVGITLLLGIVPIGHVALNQNGPATALTLIALGAAAILLSWLFQSKIGRGEFPGDGILIDLRGSAPEWFLLASRSATTLPFGTWFLSPLAIRRTWTVRPPLAPGTPEEALHAART